ncbi:MAG: penicillin-binding protein activator [Alphaproteobacteria bacterium]|jgi:branched-chain amino acid transport system substrate-binding protein|nr:penicillin-binding protein activator [Alphaproteobacteria bacterium]MCB1550834.1 penicillin-binding protein activator [Alphaproteobacteria bacterium]
MLRNLLFVFFSTLILSSCAPMSGGNWQANQRASSHPSSAGQKGMPAPATAGEANGSMANTPQNLQVKAKVALLLPLSGRGQETGEAMMNASLLAMNDLNASDLFELMPKDTNEGAAHVAQQALQDGAGLILGPLFSDDTKAVAPFAVQRGVGIVSFSTDTAAAVGTTFLMGFVPQTQVEQIIDYAGSRGFKNIALIAPRDAYGNAVAASFYAQIQRRSLNNAGLVRYDGGQLPDAVQISDLKRLPLQAVLIAAPGPTAAKISALLNAQGIPSNLVKRLGTGLWDDPSAQNQPDLQGAWYAAAPPDLRLKFERRYREMYGETPPRLASLAYDATALAVVLSKSNQGYGRNALTNPNGFAGVDGIFRFRMDGLADRGLGILEIRNGGAIVIQNAPSSFAAAKK